MSLPNRVARSSSGAAPRATSGIPARTVYSVRQFNHRVCEEGGGWSMTCSAGHVPACGHLTVGRIGSHPEIGRPVQGR